jgi:hypothetical protein
MAPYSPGPEPRAWCEVPGSRRPRELEPLKEAPVRPSLLMLAVLLLSGCSPRADQVFLVPDRLISGSSGPQPGYTIKLVRGKESPYEIVGDDGSRCRLTVERFAGVNVCDWLACEWTIVPDSTGDIARTDA